MFEQTFTAKTVEEAVQIGLKEMHVKEHQVKIEVLQQGKKGLFGFGQQDAEVRLSIIDPELKKQRAEKGLQTKLESTPFNEDVQSEERDAIEDETKQVVVAEQVEDAIVVEEVTEEQDVETEPETMEKIDVPSQKENARTKLIDSAKKTEHYVLSIIKEMGINATAEHVVVGNEVTIEFFSDEAARIIGKRGQTLNALQTLALNYLQHIQKGYCIVTLDIEDYRHKRQETLENLALNMSKKAIATNEPVKFEPMPNYERKVMHQILSNIENIETYSEGRDPHRYLVIKAK